MVEPHSSNFRVITTNFLCVRIFRKFTVIIFSFARKIVLNQKYLATFEIHVPVKFNVLMQIFVRLFQAIYIYWKHDCLALHKLFIVNLYLCLCRKQLKTTWSFWHHIFADVTTDVSVNSSSWKFLSFLKSYNFNWKLKKTRGPLVLYRSPDSWGYVKISGYWGKDV